MVENLDLQILQTLLDNQVLLEQQIQTLGLICGIQLSCLLSWLIFK